LLLWLLPSILSSQSSGKPPPTLCQQSPTRVSCRAAALQTFPEELGQGVKDLELCSSFIHNLLGNHMSAFRQLECLDLSFNQLEALSAPVLAQLPQLRSLLLGSNRLDINYVANGQALHQLQNIEVLDLSANALESPVVGWYISSLPSLRVLDLSGNRMTRLLAGVFASSPRLRELNLSDNYLMEIEEGAFEALEELEVLNLALNSLHCIAGFSLMRLQVLNLSHNALELFVLEEREEPYLLHALDLSYNRLLHFPKLPSAYHLTGLNLSNNLIASLHPGSHDPRAFMLLYEEMRRSNGTWHMAGLPSVTDLDLSNNQLQLLPVTFFQHLGSLHSLSLAENCLQEVARESPAGDTEAGGQLPALSVRWLDLRDNDLRVLPRWFFPALPQLERVHLGSNSLQPCGSPWGRNPAPGDTCTPFYNLPGLRHLSLCKNSIAKLQPFAFNQTPLLSLDLSGNRDLLMAKEALAGLELSLQKLSLRGNQMDKSRAELPCLGALKVLDLSGNRLSLLPPGVSCSPLESLDLRHNRLLRLEMPALTSWSRSLRDVALAGNPFSCCSLGWLD
ncbi:LRC32 protein, partial [Rhinopomastus cyanomelas]|nr:LRC32 protein [Rhinopomastus cyanomelas]